jgi:hypothetical protein
MTSEDMDAELARMDAHLRWLHHDMITELTEEIAVEKNPYSREFYAKLLEEVRAIGNGRYD